MTTAPIRFSGALSGGEYDALADLFLGEGSADAPGAKAERHRPGEPTHPKQRSEPLAVEAMILGHLPVLAGAWAMQYAREVSERRGGWVGVISVRGGQVAVELVGASGQNAGEPGEERASLEEAVRAGARLARHWLLRVEPAWEQSLAQLDGVERVTLLSGADEAAIVASYQTLKQVHEGGGRALSVAIMGSSPAQAQEAVARLSKASEAFLGHAAPMAACVPAIGPGRTVTLYRAASGEGPTAVLESALRWLREVPVTAGATVHGHSPRSSVEATSRVKSAAAPPVGGEQWHPAPGAAGIAAATEQWHPGLTGLIPGLTGVRARCPHASGVELAVDGAGTLHLLTGHTTGADATSDLSAAGAWAVENLAVLRLTPGCESLRDGAPVLHLFTERAAELRRLLASAIRVHALARVGGAWAAIDLN